MKLFETALQGWQVLGFLWCGCALSVPDGLLYLLRKKGKVWCAVADLLFVPLFFALFYLTDLVCLNGRLKWFSIPLCLLGFWLGRAILGVPIKKLIDILCRFRYNLREKLASSKLGGRMLR